MNNTLLSRNTGRFLLAFACVAAALAQVARAQTDATVAMAVLDQHEPVRLDNYVVSASRTPQDPRYVSSSVSVLPLEDLHLAQIGDLHTALAQTPGVTVVGYGGTGSASTVYIRGGSAAQTLIIVDGIRMNSRQTDFISRSTVGGASLAGLDRVEVLRGPQGTLYGSSAMGGVVLMDTARGCGTPSGSVEVGGGSFQTLSSQMAVQGGTQTFGYSASLGYGKTSNARPENDDKQWNYSARVEEKLSPALLVGLTFRGVQGKYEEPGSAQYFSPGKANANSYLATAYAEYSNDGVFKSRLTTGWHQSDYSWFDFFGADYNSYSRNTREVIDWQNSWTPNSKVSVVAGVNTEWSHYKAIKADTLKDNANGLYLSTDLHPLEPWSITAGMRYDHFDTAGDATTGRLGTAYRLEKTDTKFRATIGTAFNAPGMTERFGSAPWYEENPTLHPEKSTGWDVGIDQSLLKGALTIETTYFQNKFRDMIVGQYTGGLRPYQWQNVARARTEGVEVGVVAKLTSTLKARITGTYLDVYDTTSGHARVAYKPRKSGDADLQWQVTKEWNVGGGIHYVADRMRSSTAKISDYSLVRFYTSYEVATNMSLKLHVENALNRAYEEIYGYPALSRGYFGGVEWKF